MVKKDAMTAAVDLIKHKPGELPDKARQRMSSDDLHKIVVAFITLIDGLYAHLPQKRAMYGHDPVQRLRLLQQRIGPIDEPSFHRTLSEIITDLRDAHTRYIGPTHYQGRVAVLPLLIESSTSSEDLLRISFFSTLFAHFSSL